MRYRHIATKITTAPRPRSPPPRYELDVVGADGMHAIHELQWAPGLQLPARARVSGATVRVWGTSQPGVRERRGVLVARIEVLEP